MRLLLGIESGNEASPITHLGLGEGLLEVLRVLLEDPRHDEAQQGDQLHEAVL